MSTEPEFKRGDIVRFKWGFRSGRWVVVHNNNRFWPGALKIRCIVAPRGKSGWKVGDGEAGWVKAKMELVERPA